MRYRSTVLNNRTSWDVSIGPWRAVIDLLTMDTAGWGRAGTAVPQGAVSELPNLPFLSPRLSTPRQGHRGYQLRPHLSGTKNQFQRGLRRPSRRHQTGPRRYLAGELYGL
jgi:hypothetical protein